MTVRKKGVETSLDAARTSAYATFGTLSVVQPLLVVQPPLIVQHPLIYTAPQRLGPLVHDEIFRRLCRSRDYLAAGLEQPMRLADAAREACLSPYHYHRLFARTFG